MIEVLSVSMLSVLSSCRAIQHLWHSIVSIMFFYRWRHKWCVSFRKLNACTCPVTSSMLIMYGSPAHKLKLLPFHLLSIQSIIALSPSIEHHLLRIILLILPKLLHIVWYRMWLYNCAGRCRIVIKIWSVRLRTILVKDMLQSWLWLCGIVKWIVRCHILLLLIPFPQTRWGIAFHYFKLLTSLYSN